VIIMMKVIDILMIHSGTPFALSSEVSDELPLTLPYFLSLVDTDWVISVCPPNYSRLCTLR
jgi:hypothetical protein